MSNVPDGAWILDTDFSVTQEGINWGLKVFNDYKIKKYGKEMGVS